MPHFKNEKTNKIFEVNEEHASQVLRRQAGYKEVFPTIKIIDNKLNERKRKKLISKRDSR